MIQENSYWYIDSSQEEQVLKACCTECQQTQKVNGWFWEGTKHGYSYDMNCSICNKILSLRSDNVYSSTI